LHISDTAIRPVIVLSIAANACVDTPSHYCSRFHDSDLHKFTVTRSERVSQPLRSFHGFLSSYLSAPRALKHSVFWHELKRRILSAGQPMISDMWGLTSVLKWLLTAAIGPSQWKSVDAFIPVFTSYKFTRAWTASLPRAGQITRRLRGTLHSFVCLESMKSTL
jgi:hypothetical protein